MPQTNYTLAQWNEIGRKTLNPSISSTYLPDGSPYTTPSLSPGVRTALALPTTIKTINNFAFNDIGGGVIALQYVGTVTSQFSIDLWSGVQTSINNTIIELLGYKNGVLDPGLLIPRKVGTGTDTGALSMGGTVELAPNDYIQLYVSSTLTSTITFISTSILLKEIN